MKKLIIIILTVHCSLITVHSLSQPCLPEGITFTTQSQIDSFQVNYPGCTEIEGDVLITGEDIINLNGLDVLTSIGGDLNIEGNDSLVDLAGLDNLDSIGGSLTIHNDSSLQNLHGLENLEHIDSSLEITKNKGLDSITALGNITHIGGDLIIGKTSNLGGGGRPNDSLASLAGLEGITYIGGSLSIANNGLLTSLSGLDNVNSISGNLSIFQNHALTSLAGLEGLTSIGGQLRIGFSGLYFSGGNNSLMSLTGLEGLTSIGGSLSICANDALTSLAGLEGLTSIEGCFKICDNYALTTLEGLEELTFIGHLLIGSPGHGGCVGNPSLMSLTGLEGLTSIGGRLKIFANDALTSLSGLDNIESGTIDDLYIRYNDSLSTCHVQSVCDYLISPGGTIEINDNATGCNSPEEVEEACDAVSINELPSTDRFTISPNPIESTTIIKYNLSHNSPVFLKIFDVSGREIKTLVNEAQNQGEQRVVFNTSGLKPGIYFTVLKTNEGIQTRKIIKL